MDNSFILLSTMSPKINKTNRNHRGVPTKLALKKNIRRSSIFASLPTTARNNSLILVDDSPTDTTNSHSSYSGLDIKNSVPIVISDSDSMESENCSPFEKLKTTGIHNKFYKIPNHCGLSESKFTAIDKWVSSVEKENTQPNSFSDDLHQVVPKIHEEKSDGTFDDLINSIKRTLRLQKSGNNTNKNLEQSQSDDKQFSSIKHYSNHITINTNLITNKNVKECENGRASNTESSAIKETDSVNSSSDTDVVEDSDDNVNYQNKLDATLLDNLYGDSWRNIKNIVVPRSEPRNRKKKRYICKEIPKTEVKLKPKKSIVHKNPYLDFEPKLQNTPSMQKQGLVEPPWFKRLETLCDSDSSDQSLNEVPQKDHLHPVKLVFDDKTKDNSDNKILPLRTKFDVVLKNRNTYLPEEKKSHKVAQNIDTSIYTEKENFSDFSDNVETLEDRLRGKLGLEKKTKFPVSMENKVTKTKALEKPNTYLLQEKKSDKNAHNIDITIDSEKENFSDFSDDDETLEDRLRRKLGLDKKTKFPASMENKEKKTEDDLNTIFNKKCNIFDGRNIPTSHNEVDLATDKLPKQNEILKKPTIAKTKVVKKKPLTISSEDSNSVGRKNGRKCVLSNDSRNQSDNTCKSFLASLSGSVPISQCDPSARIFRNNFKMYRSELVTKLFKLYNEKIFDNAIPEDSLIEWSERMTGTAGFCYCKKIARRTGLIERKVRIVLASKVLDRADRVRDTLIHEMCHAGTWIINEVSNGHGSYWKAWAHKAGQTFPELPPIKVCHNYDITTKYTYKCTKCGYSFGRHSKSVNIERKRCGHCCGQFEILINKTTKGGETKSVPVTPRKKATGFALFVKENYAIHKTPQLTHGQVMKLLGQKFGELKVSVCKED